MDNAYNMIYSPCSNMNDIQTFKFFFVIIFRFDAYDMILVMIFLMFSLKKPLPLF
jgi:hypothetical protein